MENFGFKGLLQTLWQRVIVSYKSTLIGLGVAAIGTLIDYFVQSPNKVVAGIFAVIGSVFILVKEKYRIPTPDPLPPKE